QSDPFFLWQHNGNVLSCDRTWNSFAVFLAFFFKIWKYRTGEAGRKTKILFLFLGQYDVYLRTGRRYSILLLFRMGHVCFQSICCTDGHGHGMGRRLPIISLEFHPLGFLSGTCSRLCLYAPRPENPTSALLGSLPSCDWPPCGRHPGPGDRSVRPVRSACWHSYDLQCGYPSDGKYYRTSFSY